MEFSAFFLSHGLEHGMNKNGSIEKQNVICLICTRGVINIMAKALA